MTLYTYIKKYIETGKQLLNQHWLNTVRWTLAFNVLMEHRRYPSAQLSATSNFKLVLWERDNFTAPFDSDWQTDSSFLCSRRHRQRKHFVFTALIVIPLRQHEDTWHNGCTVSIAHEVESDFSLLSRLLSTKEPEAWYLFCRQMEIHTYNHCHIVKHELLSAEDTMEVRFALNDLVLWGLSNRCPV